MKLNCFGIASKDWYLWSDPRFFNIWTNLIFKCEKCVEPFFPCLNRRIASWSDETLNSISDFYSFLNNNTFSSSLLSLFSNNLKPLSSLVDTLYNKWALSNFIFMVAIIMLINISLSRYNSESHNCYSFVLTFLRSLQQQELKPYLKDKTIFCEHFVSSQARIAAKYISLYRQVKTQNIVIQWQRILNFKCSNIENTFYASNFVSF